MSDSFSLISCTPISDSELAAFVVEIGGIVGEGHGHLGRLSRGRDHVWIFNSPEELESAVEVLGEALAAKLHCAPRSHIVLEVSSGGSSQALAVEFVSAFLQRWPQSVADRDSRVFSPDEVLRMRQGGGNFWQG